MNNLCSEAIMKNWIIILGLLSTSLSLKSQDIKDLDKISLDFNWDSKWSMRYDYQILSPRDSTLIGKLNKVSESFWQQEIYDVEGNWLDTYRFLKNEDGLVSISKGESIIDDRYYANGNLQKRLVAKDGKPCLEWYLSYNANNSLERFSIKDSTVYKEIVILYDTLARVEKLKNFINGTLISEEHYVYNSNHSLIQRYSLTAELDSIHKTDFLIKNDLEIERLNYNFVAGKWALLESKSFNYRPNNGLSSIVTLQYSAQGNCIFSQTDSFDSKGLLVSSEKIDLISGDWQLIKSYYQSAEQGGIVLGVGR
tara:strand:+ start:35875 stop:36804 length:930 start_codon:yes stop_codon:yes gene_type:complete